MKYDLSEITGAIKARRTIFPEQFTSRKVHREIVEKILDTAIWAPTHGKTQPWRFKVFMDNGIEKLSVFQSELYKNLTDKNDFSQPKYDKLKERPLKSSVVIAICLERTPNTRIPELEEIEAVACAVQNMFITCTAYGLGAFWSTGGVTYWDETKKWLGLNEEDRVLGFFYIGYTDIEWPRAHRKPLEYVTEWVTE